MLYSLEDLQLAAVDAFGGRSPEAYVSEGVPKLAKWLSADPTNQRWKRFGPYWGVVKELIAKFSPNEITGEWGDVPSYLSRYNYQSDALNLLAALMYLNREGEYVSTDPSEPHTIQLPDGSQALYVPNSGLIEP